MKFVCSYEPCSKTFKRAPAHAGKTKSYCCKECKKLDKNVTYDCPTCHKTVTKPKSLYVKNATNFCSKACYDIDQSKFKVALICDCCKKEFTRTPSRVSDSERTYCSDECLRKDMVGKHHGQWKGGVSRTTEGYPIVLTNREDRVGNYTAVHRLVAEQHLGRHLEKYEHILHIDNDKMHNTDENLFICGSISESVRRIAGSLPWPTKSNLKTYEKDKMKTEHKVEKFPILSIQNGQCLTNVKMLPQVLREMRPNRINSNEAAECLEVLIQHVDSLDSRLIILKADMRILINGGTLPEEASQILGSLIESISDTQSKLGLD